MGGLTRDVDSVEFGKRCRGVHSFWGGGGGARSCVWLMGCCARSASTRAPDESIEGGQKICGSECIWDQACLPELVVGRVDWPMHAICSLPPWLTP